MIVSLQYLRAVAALMVVAFHACEKLGALGGDSAAPAGAFTVGLAGVDIFFVLSGFIMLATTRGKDVTATEFARRRIERILPGYWLLTSLVVVVVVHRPDLLASTTFDVAHVAASYLFIPWQHPVLDAKLPLLVPGWTLNYEMAFYALFAASLFAPERVRVPALVGVLTSAAVAGLFVPAKSLLAFYTDPIILEFAAGLVVASAWRPEHRISRKAALSLAVAGFVLMWLGSGTELPRIVWAGIPAVMIVAGVVHADNPEREPLRIPMLLGNASYSIYLSHVIALPVLAKIWTAAGLGFSGVGALAFLAGSLVFASVVGVAFYGTVERPLLKFFAARRKRRAKKAVAHEHDVARIRRIATAR